MSIRLGEVCKFQSGGTPSRKNKEYFQGTIPWITTVALNGKTIDEQDAVEWITEKAIEESAAKIVPKESILIGTRVGVGKVAINTVPMSTSQDIISLINIDTKQWDKGFICKFISSKSDFLNSQARGATIKGIKIEVLENLQLPKLELEEQRKIAAVLDKVSELIAKRCQQLDKLDLLVKSKFVEMFGDLADPACKHIRCKLEEICIDSDDIKCGPFGTQLSKNEYQEKGVAVWEIPQINREFKEQPVHFVTDEKAKQLMSYSLLPGDIAMSRKGNVGRCALFPKDFAPGIIHSDVLRIRVDKNRVNPCFMMYQLHFSKAVEHQIAMVSSGAVMAGINVTKLKQIYVHIPAFGLQNKFADFVEQTEKTKTSINQSLEKLETLKKALMQEYFG